MEVKVFKVEGMTSNHCKDRVETHLLRLKNVKDVDVDVDKSEVSITGDNVYDENVRKVVIGLGYSFVGEVSAVF